MASLRFVHAHAIRACAQLAFAVCACACASASTQPALLLRLDWLTHAQFEATRSKRDREVVLTATVSMRVDPARRTAPLLDPSLPTLPQLITDCELEHHALCTWARDAEDTAWIEWLQDWEAAR